ncbi:MAG TPA: IclR family transcriptional regulator [Dehalococcoidales bacterium]|nr:IclR family transcriptional regulator [Dehalococcoidales bacterium]
MNNRNQKTSTPQDDGKETAVQSIKRAAEILNCISDGINSVTEIAGKCNLSKSTVHRLLKALCESELVMQDPLNHQYFLGYSIIKLVSTPMATQEFLTSCAADEMSRLSESTGETVSLGIKMGLKNINIHVVNSQSDLKVDGAKLRIRPVQVGVDGLVLLSQLDDKQIANILNTVYSDKQNKASQTVITELINRIKQIRSLGFATGHSELTLGVTCISAPLKNYALPAVLNLVGPEIRMKPKIQSMTAELLTAAGRISGVLANRNSPTQSTAANC